METRQKKSEQREADMIYLVMVFGAFILAVMVLVSVYSAKPINIYVIPETSAAERSAETAKGAASPANSDLTEEPPVTSEPEVFLKAASETGPREVLMEKSIDINHADREDLERLPGIGPVLAGRIIEYRTSYGDFFEIDEIMEVSGIGEKTFDKIKDFIYVS